MKKMVKKKTIRTINKIKEKPMLKKRTKTFLINIALLSLIFNIAAMPITMCYFVDVETSNGNEFTAGSLDLSLRDSTDNQVTQKLFDSKINYGQEVTKNVFVKKEGSLSFEYTITAEKISGSDSLCNALKVGIERDGVGGIYTGSLLGLNPSLDITGSQDEVSFRIYLDDNSSTLQDKECQFKIKFDAKQQGISSGGFSSSEVIIDNKIETGWWVDPSVEIKVPNGGETYLVGDVVNIQWEASSTDSSSTSTMEINIYLSKDSGSTYPTQLATDTDNDGSFNWTVGPGDKSTTMKIKITAKDSHGLIGSDESDAVFDPEDADTETTTETSSESSTEGSLPDETLQETASVDSGDVNSGDGVENSASEEEEKIEVPSNQPSAPESDGDSSEN